MRRSLPLAMIALLGVCAATPALSADDKTRVACFSIGSENYKDKSKYDGGLAACSRMIKSGAYKGEALAAIYRARGSWNEKKGAYDAALADYAVSIRLEPNNVESYDYRADVYQDKGDLDRALEEYNAATRINPDYAAAYFSRGRIYEKKGDIDKARAEYSSAIELPATNRIAQWAQDNARARLKALDEEAKK